MEFCKIVEAGKRENAAMEVYVCNKRVSSSQIQTTNNLTVVRDVPPLPPACHAFRFPSLLPRLPRLPSILDPSPRVQCYPTLARWTPSSIPDCCSDSRSHCRSCLARCCSGRLHSRYCSGRCCFRCCSGCCRSRSRSSWTSCRSCRSCPNRHSRRPIRLHHHSNCLHHHSSRLHHRSSCRPQQCRCS